MTDDGTGLLTIGALSRSTGLSVRTIRYRSDEGALPPVARSSGGYRLYDAGSVARLELVRTLRERIRTRLRFSVGDLPDDPTPEQVNAWVEPAELIRSPAFRARMRETVESNAADRGPDVAAGTSLWFMSRLVQLAGEARERGVDPASPEADEVLGGLPGDADGAGLPARVESAAHAEPARFRELCARVRGLEPLPAHRAEFAWVVAALRARTDR
ncbi:MerR family transcriptional regulator [Streptomyces sp. NPDC102256]|uniref:MerR family transcriptional regulator n=1 Tax=unclassified Streptomyces TaxID=2593676 RepID=UPI0013BB58AF|nr:MerR family transcriptional regulator [Streptomyces sp. SID14446]NEB27609.1 MerR family transcriptional regulator [Streptomyces sp. SID14446]